MTNYNSADNKASLLKIDTLPLVGRVKIFLSYGAPALFFLGNVILDAILYHEGLAWTFLVYEDALIFLTFSRKKNLIAFWIGSFIFVTKILYFVFHLSLYLLWSFLLFKIYLALTFCIFLGCLIFFPNQFRKFLLSFFVFLSLALMCITFDKKLFDDKLASSYLPHMLGHFSSDVRPFPNLVHTEIKKKILENRGVVLIVWESLGIPSNFNYIEHLNRFNLEASEEIIFGGGSTVTSEIQYLCGVAGYGAYESCLPKLVQKSYALHGNSLAYFDRNELYKEFGFRDSFGKDSLLNYDMQYAESPKNCSYAYNAICDNFLFDVLFDVVEKNQCDGFFYALTIDSHFPYQKYKKHNSELFDDLFKLIIKAKKIKSKNLNCDIYIVGDHPPPLAPGFSKQKILFIKI